MNKQQIQLKTLWILAIIQAVSGYYANVSSIPDFKLYSDFSIAFLTGFGNNPTFVLLLFFLFANTGAMLCL